MSTTTFTSKIASTLVGAALIGAGLPAGKAHAHSDAELDAWLLQWSLAVVRQGEQTQELSLELVKMRQRHPEHWGDEVSPPPVPPEVATGPEWSAVVYAPTPTSSSALSSTEQWRGLISAFFAEADMAWAMRVMACESGGNPDATNPSSGAAGLFQHLPKYWAERSSNAGVAGSTPYDPPANVAVAAWLFYEGGGQSHWVCK